MKSSLSLGKLLGIPFGVNYSWFVIFIFVIVILAQYYFPSRYIDWSTPVYWLAGLGTSLLFFVSVVAHELAHSLVAISRGIPVKSITLFVFGGVARITREATTPNTELLMTAAGPASSVVLAGVFALIWLLSRNALEPLAAISYYLCLINLALAVFNMIPGFPMDGGRVLRAIVWWRYGSYRRATRVAAIAGQVIGYLLVLGGVVMIFLVDLIWGLWAVFIGIFLSVSAAASYRQELLRENIKGLTAVDVMNHDLYFVPPDLPLQAAVDGHLQTAGREYLVIGESSGPAGIITRKSAKQLAEYRLHSATVAEAMIPVEEFAVVSAGDNGLMMIEKMEEKDTELALVIVEDKLVGIVERDKLLDAGLGHSYRGVLPDNT